jgi:hypothetical protein
MHGIWGGTTPRTGRPGDANGAVPASGPEPGTPPEVLSDDGDRDERYEQKADRFGSAPPMIRPAAICPQHVYGPAR